MTRSLQHGILRTGFVLAVAALLNLTLFVPAARADLIQTRASDAGAAPEERAAVEHRLVELGQDTDSAHVTAALLSENTARRYAACPSTLENAGGLWLEEWIFGLFTLGWVALIAWNIHDQRQEAKDD